MQRELRRTFGDRHKLSAKRAAGEVLFSLDQPSGELLSLKTAHEAFKVIPFDTPRPRGILEPLKLRELVKAISTITSQKKAPTFSSFRVSAAGADSKDLKRIREAISAQTMLREDEEDGDMLIRIRRSKVHDQGWDVLLRLTPRPLHVRAWRKADYRGALDATIARVMVELAGAKGGEKLLDPMCGSATILIEQSEMSKNSVCVGIERSHNAVKSGAQNVAAARAEKTISLLCADSSSIPFADGTFDAIAVNPPWGEAIKEKESLQAIYSSLIKECARVLKSRARMCVIVQNVDELNRAISDVRALHVVESHRVLQRKGFHPTIVLIEKR